MKIDTYAGTFGDFSISVAPILEQPAAAVPQPIIAQQFEDNFFDRSGDIIGNFVESGQLWALLIGVVLGYVIRGITTY
ncbi:hypothetical protein N836_32875 [Leptolyngbya sp. Heron Island J]|uniref:hypothetical protein n=1 Tax=Leptolyngbya sp. Heron Island J TaxID=1385935 RepID=UPI0003B9AB2C|nr:hypothetical protein [Leptolyngbya sp. Heron Island J]ESA38224.1 hypothetical protein N836_32875 [Leptolyngbya sp. Heron Island J]